MATLLPSLREAVAELVHDGDTVALEGFTHLIPHAAGHEIIRQHRRDLTVIRMTPDVVYDQLIGAGAVRKLVFSWGGNPGVGSLHRLRDAVEHQWPRPIELLEYTHAMMVAAYVAGASALPFGVLRAAQGTDLPRHNTLIRNVVCPYTGELLTTVPAHRPDVTIIHAQQGDRAGNVQFWGISGILKEAVFAAKRALVTVEQLVDRIVPVPGGVVLPSMTVSALCVVPHGAHPAYTQGFDRRDNRFYRAWDNISRDRDTFVGWLDQHVYGTNDHAGLLAGIGVEPLPAPESRT